MVKGRLSLLLALGYLAAACGEDPVVIPFPVGDVPTSDTEPDDAVGDSVDDISTDASDAVGDSAPDTEPDVVDDPDAVTPDTRDDAGADVIGEPDTAEDTADDTERDVAPDAEPFCGDGVLLPWRQPLVAGRLRAELRILRRRVRRILLDNPLHRIENARD